AAFELVRHVPITIPHVGGVLAYLLAAAAYWAILWALFWRGRSAALTIGLAHVVLWLVINLGMDLSAWVRHKEAAMRAAMPPPAAAPQ
ncbi:MAG TPA: hypothetical protein VD963_03310, partial [Phycisphaerales bacterium]|nr:hypothetical protein [Phycisphaerales bacterium]